MSKNKQGKVLTEVIKFYHDYMKLEDGVIFCKLFRGTESEKVSVWTIKIGFIDDTPVLPENISGDPIQNTAKIWTESTFIQQDKVFKIKLSKNPTLVSKGLQKTNIITQAIKQCRKKIFDKLDEGYTMTLDDSKVDIDHVFETDKWRFSPPAFHDVNDHPNKKSNKTYWDFVSYPCFIQPKKDGERILCVYSEKINIFSDEAGTNTSHLSCFTRNRKEYTGNQPVLKQLLSEFLKNFPEIYLDGEIKGESESFQVNSGMARRQKSEADILYYYVFDCFDLKKPNETYRERLARLTKMFEIYKTILTTNEFHDHIIMLKTFEVQDYDQLESYKTSFIEDDKDEGAIIRMPDSLYEYSFQSEKRMKYVLKWKDFKDAEWPVVSFTCAVGDHQGALIFECETYSGKVFGISFSQGVFSVPDRQKLFTYLNDHKKYFEDNFKGQLLTIKYQSLSDDGVPIRGGALRFRETQVHEKLLRILSM